MHSFVSCLMHCVWATKERRPLIKLDKEELEVFLKKHGMEYVEQDLG